MVGYVDGSEIEARELAEAARRRQDSEADTKAKDETRELDQKRARTAGQGLAERHQRQALADFALGRAPDREGATGRVAADLEAKGHSAEDAKRLAPTIAEDMFKYLDNRINKRMNETKVAREDAGYTELAKETTEAQQAGGRTEGGFSDSVSFYQKLQQSQDRVDPYQVAIARNTREMAADMSAMLKKVVAARGDNAGLVGPA